MNVDRREFLGSVGTFVIALLLPRGVFAQIAGYSGKVLTRADFAARIRDWFYLYNTDATHQSNLQLIRITDDTPNKRVEQFTLTFHSGLQDIAIPTGYYEVAGERFCLFVQHTHRQAGRHYYRATFGLLK